MTGKPMNIVGVLTDAKDGILDEAAGALGSSRLSHYDATGPAERRARLEKLFDVTVGCLRKRELVTMIGYSKQIAHERFESGFGISEVQTAFNVLEESMWRRLAAAAEPAQIVESLGLLTTVLGVGKDEFARTYVSLASSQHVPSLDLRAMFHGTGG